MKIGYFADGPWSHCAFEKLIRKKNLEFSFICARFDKNDEKLKNYSKAYNIPFLVEKNINDSEFLAKKEVSYCDLFVSMSFNQIFKKNTFTLPPLGTINCHAGKLPFYRGRNILNWSLINDENEFGITVHYVDEGIDTGDIIRQTCFEIGENDNYASLLERAYLGCGDILSEVIDDFLLGNVHRTSQDTINPHGLICSGRGEGDEKLNWDQPSRDVFNFVRAICEPGPRARCFLGEYEIKINKVKYFDDVPVYKGIPGAILSKFEDGFLVKTQDSYVLLSEWDSCIKLKVGDRLS